MDEGSTAVPAPAEAAALRAELLAMAEEDQLYRDVERISALPPDERHAVMEEGAEADRTHTARLKEIVATHGWPQRSLVGEDGCRAAFLIVQHADHDPGFQAECLPRLEALAEEGEVSRVEVAYLTDRVRVKQGRAQVYGTQYRVATDASGNVLAGADGRLEYLLPIVEDVEHLDERRLAAGLRPWAEYEREMAASQGREPADAPLGADAPR